MGLGPDATGVSILVLDPTKDYQSTGRHPAQPPTNTEPETTTVGPSHTDLLRHPRVDLTHGLSNPTHEFMRLFEYLGSNRGTWIQDQSDGDTTSLSSVPRSPRIHREVAARIVAAYEAGATTTELRHEFGLSQGGVVGVLKRHKVTTRFQGLSESEATEARDLYESGLSLTKVGEKLDRAPNTVRKALLRAGVRMRARGRNRHVQPGN